MVVPVPVPIAPETSCAICACSARICAKRAWTCAATPLVEPVELAVTNTVVVATTEPLGLVAVSVYTVVTVGDTVVAVPVRLLSPDIEVVLALFTLQDSTELAPDTMLAGFATKELMLGAGHATVALQVLVAMVEEASVA